MDLFVGRYVKFDPKYRAFYAPNNYPGPLDYERETNKLFHNNCDGTFTEVTDKSGIGSYVGRAMGVTAADFDNDGWDDIYVANDRTENYDYLTLADLAVYVRTLEPRPNRWRLPESEISPAQEQGRAIFERTVDKFKNPIPENNRCSYCHSGPKGTNQKLFDVGTRRANDKARLLKSAPLTNIALTAPYLHDGSARSVEETWTVYNPADKHGRTNDLTKDELNDLIEYLRTR